MKVLQVLLDPGHGKKTPGKRSPKWDNGKQLFEWEFNRQLAAKIFDECMKHAQLEPHMIVKVDDETDVALTTRAKRANVFGKDNTCFISIHGNAFDKETAHGWEVWTYPGQSEADKLATCIYDAVHAAFPDMTMRSDMSDGDVDKESKFTVLQKTIMPAVLTENCFYTNFEECMDMLDDAWQQKMAEAHVAGILNWWNSKNK